MAAEQTSLIVAEHFVHRPRIEHGKLGAAARNGPHLDSATRLPLKLLSSKPLPDAIENGNHEFSPLAIGSEASLSARA
jgi:hypothetical protein